MLPRLTGRALILPRLATLQPYLWFAGMMCFSIPNHIVGLLGMPRRIYTSYYAGSAVAANWQPYVNFSAVGGVILVLSSICYLLVIVGTMLVAPRGETAAIEYAESLVAVTPGPSIWDRFGFWTVVGVVLILIAYAQPLYHLHTMPSYPSPGFSPF